MTSAAYSAASASPALMPATSTPVYGESPLVIGEPGSLLSLLLDEQRQMTPLERSGERAGADRASTDRTNTASSAVDIFSRLHEQHELPAQSRYYRDLIPAGLPGQD